MTSKLHIQTAVRNEKTFLKDSFANQPFKIANVTEDDKALRLVIMSSSPGILDGDKYCMQLDLEEGSLLKLETQSYQRLFQMHSGASQSMEVRMKNKSSFIYLPHPVVPHGDSKFLSRSKIYMSDGCSLLWGEVLTSGRKLNGESFCFSIYHNIIEVYKNEKLVVKENLLIKPGAMDIAAIGQMEDFSHQASLIFIHEDLVMKDFVDGIRHAVAEENDIELGVTELPVNGLIVRILGNKGEQLFGLIKKIASDLQTIINKKNIVQPVHAN